MGILRGGEIMAKKKKKSEVDEERLELTKKLNKQQKLFCYLTYTL